MFTPVVLYEVQSVYIHTILYYIMIYYFLSYRTKLLIGPRGRRLITRGSNEGVTDLEFLFAARRTSTRTVCIYILFLDLMLRWGGRGGGKEGLSTRNSDFIVQEGGSQIQSV